MRDTAQRRAIRRVLEEAARPLAPEEVLRASKAHAPGLGIATVYRNLKSLAASGEVAVVEMPGAPPRYERAGGGHHHHFRCRRCDRVYELSGCVPGVRDLLPPGFRLDAHEVLLEGTCRDCGRRRGPRQEGR
ncbi:MAG: transcriptional repressor [Elusimicrobia bacterium]|nr:transcriptional repressor [Elusimicrobiota bacterium]